MNQNVHRCRLTNQDWSSFRSQALNWFIVYLREQLNSLERIVTPDLIQFMINEWLIFLAFIIQKTSFCTLQSVTIHDFMNLLLMRTNSRNLLRSAAALQWIFSFSCTKLISIGISGRVCLTLLGLLQCASAFLCILRFDAVPWQWHLDDILMSGLKWPPAVAVNEVPGHMNNYWQEGRHSDILTFKMEFIENLLTR